MIHTTIQSAGDLKMPESKFRENLRYLGYTIGVVAGIVVVSLLYWLLAPIMDIIMLIILLAGAAFFVLILIASIFYLFIAKEK